MDEQEDPYVALTEEQHDKLYGIYSEGIHKVLGDVCSTEGESSC